MEIRSIKEKALSKITIIGSGPSGVHFALSLLKKRHLVEMIDVGFSGETPVNPVPLSQIRLLVLLRF